MKRSPCIICSETEHSYVLKTASSQVLQCGGCRLLSNAEADHAEVVAESMRDGGLIDFRPNADHLSTSQVRELESALFAQLASHGAVGGDVLLVSEQLSPVLAQAIEQRGYNVKSTLAIAEEIATISGEYDAVILLHCLERSSDPLALLRSCRQRLSESGLLCIQAVSIDSLSRWRVDPKQVIVVPEARHFFNRMTLQLLLEKSGFRRIHLVPGSTAGIAESLNNLRSKVQGNLSRLGTLLKVPATTLTVLARKGVDRNGQKLSIVMPVLNEINTFEETLTRVLNKKVEGIADKEVIVVEGNSTDGTRDLVAKYIGHPQVKVLFEDNSTGKGYNVRKGFEAASGDILLIQDADAEYDVDDYDALVEPLVNYRQCFVLGTRHKGDWKMRSFVDNPQLATIFNLGQIIFTTLTNVLYKQSMTDPFTMYKVLRAESIYGLKLECDKFDFDLELVIKLIQKGFPPLEIPVNYWSRTYKEGKKIKMFRDPILWVKASFRYKLASPFKSDYQRVTEDLRWLAARADLSFAPPNSSDLVVESGAKADFEVALENRMDSSGLAIGR